MSEDVRPAIGAALQAAQRVLIVGHIRPDGDAIGSLVGLGLALKAAGKQVVMLSEDGVPPALRHIFGAAEVVKKPGVMNFDLVVVVDCSDMQRTGSLGQNGLVPQINIDHHVTNLNFATWNLVDPGAVATAEILANHLKGWGLPVTPEVASALLTGIVTDTLGFRTSNMTPAALRMAADLMEAGANLPELYQLALNQRSFEATRFWASGLAALERQEGVVWTRLTLEDRKKAGYGGKDDADLITVLSSIQDAAITLIFVEQPGGKVKVSWRSQPGYDVAQLALRFGGGGHSAAAGAELPGDLNRVQSDVLGATLESYAAQRSLNAISEQTG
jgi:phosphoesterase RecJ-like protein